MKFFILKMSLRTVMVTSSWLARKFPLASCITLARIIHLLLHCNDKKSLHLPSLLSAHLTDVVHGPDVVVLQQAQLELFTDAVPGSVQYNKVHIRDNKQTCS